MSPEGAELEPRAQEMRVEPVKWVNLGAQRAMPPEPPLGPRPRAPNTALRDAQPNNQGARVISARRSRAHLPADRLACLQLFLFMFLKNELFLVVIIQGSFRS